MSSINLRPTFQYSQPEAYRFSHDSVFLAQQVYDLVAYDVRSDFKVLDLCAGCGVVGLDFLFHCRQELGRIPAVCDFVEVQGEYESYFLSNAKSLGVVGVDTRFLKMNYAQLLNETTGRYDLVLCNPPYFRVGQGKMSPSEFKNRCRFYLDSDFATLLRVIVHSLKPSGQAFLLLRDLSAHNWNPLVEAQALLASMANVDIVGDVRGTALVKIARKL